MTNKLVIQRQILHSNLYDDLNSMLSYPTLLLKRQGLIIFIIPSEIPVSSLVLRKYDENHFIISYLSGLLVSVCEIKTSVTYKSLKFTHNLIFFFFTCTYMSCWLKKSHGDKWLHTLVSLTMLKRYWSGER